MTAPERIWAHLPETYGSVKIGTCADTVRYQPHGTEYILHTRAALAASPLVQEVVEEAVRAEREACAKRAEACCTDVLFESNPAKLYKSVAAAIRARGE